MDAFGVGVIWTESPASVETQPSEELFEPLRSHMLVSAGEGQAPALEEWRFPAQS